MKKIIFTLSFLLSFSLAFCQPVTLTFTAMDNQGGYIRLDHVQISDLSRNWFKNIYYPDTVLQMNNVVGVDAYEEVGLSLSQNVPNPFEGTTEFNLQLGHPDAVRISILDMNGKCIIEKSMSLPANIYTYRVSLAAPQTCFLTVRTSKDEKVLKMVNLKGAGKNDVELVGEGVRPIYYNLKSANAEVDLPFVRGDSMSYIGYATINGIYYGSATIEQPQEMSESLVLVFETAALAEGLPCPDAPTVMDFDSNCYQTVQIGLQCWLKENLRTTHYSDGTPIALGDTLSSDVPYRYYPNGDSSIVNTYGYLYNWPAMMYGQAECNATPSGVQGICPKGWHAPSQSEWDVLINHVRHQSQYWCGNNQWFIAKSLASTTGWNLYNEMCCVGDDAPNDNNATGFSAYPAGMFRGGAYFSYRDEALFWTTFASSGSDMACYKSLRNYDRDVFQCGDRKDYGLSVRCLKD